jgi:hypothetical protein
MKGVVITLVIIAAAFIAGWIFNRLVGDKVDAVVSDIEDAAKKVKEDATK